MISTRDASRAGTGDGMTTMRNAGRVGDFLRDLRWRLAQEAQQGARTFANRVPCNGCNACCWHPHIHVDPLEEPEENIAHLALESLPGGGLALKRREDNACAHLDRDGRCAVYEYRPRGCRVYDCRLQALVGVRDRFVGDRRPPEWRFEARTRREKAIVAALRMGAGAYMSANPQA
jgi:hypothetical protein